MSKNGTALFQRSADEPKCNSRHHSGRMALCAGIFARQVRHFDLDSM